ncbi:MAG: ABC transporter ATP-binding protein [Bacilli bacterium]|nr:ABC transporter ATP-binding protein [Bacilli bacterium]
MKNILEVKNINKFYGKKQVLEDVSFTIHESEILGFIGPNGSGKTTTIKLILGLQSMKSGEITINGYNIKKDFSKAIERVGAIVESPDLYMYLTGRKNLELIKDMYKDIPDGRVEDVIELVGLSNRIDDKVSKYSLGMRQRLGIAAAIINKPNLLILDEPTNGLDPEGIKELRDLLKGLVKKEKIGILISSHNLAELDNFCTDVCIIKKGKILTNKTIEDAKKTNRESYLIRLNKTTGLKKILYKEDEIVDSDTIRVYTEKDNINDVIVKLIEANYKIYGITKEELSLEDAFLNAAGGNEID